MNQELVLYEAARRSLAELHRIDEVKDIHDKAMAMRVYADQAKDTELVAKATEIRKRAERRLGELMKEQPKAKPPGGSKKTPRKDRVAEKPDPPTLAEQGIDKPLADRARKAAAMPAVQFEEQVSRIVKAAVATTEKAEIKERKVRAKKESSPRGKTGRTQVVTKLNSLAWSDAPIEARRKFVDDVGLVSIWQASSETQKVAFLQYQMTAEKPAISVAPPSVALEDGIPDFLRR